MGRGQTAGRLASSHITSRPSVASVATAARSIFSSLSENDSSSDKLEQTSLREAQLQDPLCQAMHKYLNLGVIPKDAKTATKVRQHCRHLEVHDGLLYRRGRLHADEDNERLLLQVWVPPSLQQAYLHAYHDQLGHRGRSSCWEALRRVAYWPGMFDHVAEHILRCHECATTKGLPRQGSAVVPDVGEYPFDGMVVDLVTMNDSGSADGYKKLMVFADSLSRWVEAVPLKGEPTAIEMVNMFINHIYVRYGIPRWVRSDRGPNLAAKVIKAVNDATGTNMLLSKSYHSASQGVVERFHHTLTDMLRAYDPGGEAWEDWVPFSLFAYRASPHSVTKESPAYLLYGRELRGPAENQFDPKGLRPAQASEGALAVERLAAAWISARKSTLQQQLQDKSDKDRTADRSQHFSQGDRVLLAREGKLRKLERPWEGPYRIESGPDERGNYKLRDLVSRRTHSEVAAARLKLYLTHTDSTAVSSDEYIVESILGSELRVPAAEKAGATPKRGKRARAEPAPHVLVKWRGYPKSEATWELRTELMLRCSKMVQEYERQQSAQVVQEAASREPRVMPSSSSSSDSDHESNWVEHPSGGEGSTPEERPSGGEPGEEGPPQAPPAFAPPSSYSDRRPPRPKPIPTDCSQSVTTCSKCLAEIAEGAPGLYEGTFLCVKCAPPGAAMKPTPSPPSRGRQGARSARLSGKADPRYVFAVQPFAAPAIPPGYVGHVWSPCPHGAVDVTDSGLSGLPGSYAPRCDRASCVNHACGQWKPGVSAVSMLPNPLVRWEKGVLMVACPRHSAALDRGDLPARRRASALRWLPALQVEISNQLEKENTAPGDDASPDRELLCRCADADWCPLHQDPLTCGDTTCSPRGDYIFSGPFKGQKPMPMIMPKPPGYRVVPAAKVDSKGYRIYRNGLTEIDHPDAAYKWALLYAAHSVRPHPVRHPEILRGAILGLASVWCASRYIRHPRICYNSRKNGSVWLECKHGVVRAEGKGRHPYGRGVKECTSPDCVAESRRWWSDNKVWADTYADPDEAAAWHEAQETLSSELDSPGVSVVAGPGPTREVEYSVVDLDPSAFAFGSDMRLATRTLKLVYRRDAGKPVWAPWVVVTESALTRKVKTGGPPLPPQLGLYAAARLKEPRELTSGGRHRRAETEIGRYSGTSRGHFATRNEARVRYDELARSGHDRLFLARSPAGSGFDLLDAGEGEEPPFISAANDPRNTSLTANALLTPGGKLIAVRAIPAFDWQAPTISANVASEIRFDYQDEYWDLFEHLGSADTPIVLPVTQPPAAETDPVAPPATAESLPAVAPVVAEEPSDVSLESDAWIADDTGAEAIVAAVAPPSVPVPPPAPHLLLTFPQSSDEEPASAPGVTFPVSSEDEDRRLRRRLPRRGCMPISSGSDREERQSSGSDTPQRPDLPIEMEKPSGNLYKWKFMEPALQMIEQGLKQVDARLSSRGLVKAFEKAKAQGRLPFRVQCSSPDRSLVLLVDAVVYHKSYADAYAKHGYALVPPEWVDTDPTVEGCSEIQRFFEMTFHRGKAQPLDRPDWVAALAVRPERGIRPPPHLLDLGGGLEPEKPFTTVGYKVARVLFLSEPHPVSLEQHRAGTPALPDTMLYCWQPNGPKSCEFPGGRVDVRRGDRQLSDTARRECRDMFEMSPRWMRSLSMALLNPSASCSCTSILTPEGTQYLYLWTVSLPPLSDLQKSAPEASPQAFDPIRYPKAQLRPWREVLPLVARSHPAYAEAVEAAIASWAKGPPYRWMPGQRQERAPSLQRVCSDCGHRWAGGEKPPGKQRDLCSRCALRGRHQTTGLLGLVGRPKGAHLSEQEQGLGRTVPNTEEADAVSHTGTNVPPGPALSAERRQLLEDLCDHVRRRLTIYVDQSGRPSTYVCEGPLGDGDLLQRVRDLLHARKAEELAANPQGPARNWGTDLREKSSCMAIVAVVTLYLFPGLFRDPPNSTSRPQDKRCAALFYPGSEASTRSRTFKRWKAPLSQPLARLMWDRSQEMTVTLDQTGASIGAGSAVPGQNGVLQLLAAAALQQPSCE